MATRNLSATKTDTPIIETPQSISVVTRDQISAINAQSLRASPTFDQVDFTVPATGAVSVKASMIYPAN